MYENLETRLPNQNYIPEGSRSKFNPGNVCYLLVQNYLSARLHLRN